MCCSCVAAVVAVADGDYLALGDIDLAAGGAAVTKRTTNGDHCDFFIRLEIKKIKY